MRVPIIDVDTLSRNWWLVVLRGVLGIAFGVITFVAPAISLAALVLLFGAYAFADGVLAIASAVRRRTTTDRWWILLLEGLVGIGAGLVTLFLPGITALVLLYIIAGWAVATGILELVAAVRLRKEIKHEWLLALSGIASVAFGVLIALLPGAGTLALVIWIGAYAFVFGALLVALGVRLRGLGRSRTAREVPGVA
jgi:uncharacterized membrane protein HdeD (DUF308 family)